MSLTQAVSHDSGCNLCRTSPQLCLLSTTDVSVYESLELLIRCEGWQPETFASAEEFLGCPRTGMPELPATGCFTSGPHRSRATEAHRCRTG